MIYVVVLVEDEIPPSAVDKAAGSRVGHELGDMGSSIVSLKRENLAVIVHCSLMQHDDDGAEDAVCRGYICYGDHAIFFTSSQGHYARTGPFRAEH